jgi:hypothetical protein
MKYLASRPCATAGVACIGNGALEDPRPAPDKPGKEPLAPLPEPKPLPEDPQVRRRG